MAQPPIVPQQVRQAWLARRVAPVDGSFSGRPDRCLGHMAVVGLRPPRQRIDQHDASGAEIELGERSSVGRQQQRAVAFTEESQLGTAVTIEIVACAQRLRCPQSQGQFGLQQFPLHGKTQMRRVEPAKDPMPVPIVALRPQQMSPRLGHRRTARAQCTALGTGNLLAQPERPPVQ